MWMRGLEEAAESTFMERIEKAADRHGWELKGTSLGHVESTCPYCSAHYSYRKSQVLEDGSVRCQNCDRSYLLREAQESKVPEAPLV